MLTHPGLNARKDLSFSRWLQVRGSLPLKTLSGQSWLVCTMPQVKRWGKIGRLNRVTPLFPNGALACVKNQISATIDPAAEEGTDSL